MNFADEVKNYSQNRGDFKYANHGFLISFLFHGLYINAGFKMKIERVTQNQSANEQLLYFTSSSLWDDDNKLVFISDRDGYPNVYSRDLINGNEIKLTDNNIGYMKSYVYFDGIPYKGLGKASISLHTKSGTLYYLQGREIRKVTPDGKTETIAEYPNDQMTAFTHISSDGRYLCVPTTDAECMEGGERLNGKPRYSIDKRVVKRGLSSYLRVYDTQTGKEVLCEPVKKAWITHVQFDPNDHMRILYNHEWPYRDRGIRRMWVFDGDEHIRLRPAGEGRDVNDHCVHEMWERDGRAIIYHGKYGGRRSFIGRVKPDGSDITEIELPRGWIKYGHFTVGQPGTLVSDGYYQRISEIFRRRAQWISRIDVDWDSGQAAWTPLCKHRSSWSSQDAHPHPIFDSKADYAYFTSDFEGKRAVYRVNAEKKEKRQKS